MRKILAILLSIGIFQSQLFAQTGFVPFMPFSQQTTLTGGNSVNINVGGKTTNKGAVIANADISRDATGKVVLDNGHKG